MRPTVVLQLTAASLTGGSRRRRASRTGRSSRSGSHASIPAVALLALCLPACAAESAATAGPTSRVVEVPTGDNFGMPRFVQVLVDEPGLKLVSIVLWGGARLLDQRSELAMTVMTLQGSGTLVTATERSLLWAQHAVILAPNVAYRIEADAGCVLVLLVHHLGRDAGSGPPPKGSTAR